MDGVLVVHKPLGPSSHDVVVVARRSLGMTRIGHTGTLDPQASGVLPLVLGQATRLAQHLTSSDKSYEALIRFGVVTDTHDAAGEVVVTSETIPAAPEVRAALERFRGTFEQVPPVFSAKMVGGERSYARARAGKPLASPAVRVTAHELELIEYSGAMARVALRCSAGFYVRALAHDLGQALGCGAILAALVRTEAAGFRLEDAIPFEALVQAPRAELREHVRPMEALLTAFPTVILTTQGVDWTRHGRSLGPAQMLQPVMGAPVLVRLFSPEGRFIGLADAARQPGLLRPVVVFS